MESVSYEITEESISCEGASAVTYGIRACRRGEEECPLAEVRDVTPNRARLTEFARVCNALALSPIHLTEAVEDLLAK